MPFEAIFLQDQALFRWQQYKRKIDGETANFNIWEEFKALLFWSLGESCAFVDSIWKTIKRKFPF